MMTDSEHGVACRLSETERDREWDEVASEIYAAVEETRELEDGYAFRFPPGDDRARTLADYMLFERECCPFLRFELVLEPHGGPTWLRLRGEDGAKRFLRQQLQART